MTGPDVAAVVINLVVSAIISAIVINNIDRGETDTPVQDDRPKTFTERGSWIPLFIGRDRVGANIGSLFDDYSFIENTPGPGKGSGHNPGTDERIYLESGWHRLAVGGGKASLHRIIDNGITKYDPDVPIHNDVSNLDGGYTPSGSFIDLGSEGGFYIYWGETGQPALSQLADSESTEINSQWPFIISIVWIAKRLGTAKVWPLIEYELEVRPYNEPGTLSRIPGVADWFKSGDGPSGDPVAMGGVYDTFDINNPVANNIIIYMPGDQLAKYEESTRVRITGQPESIANGVFEVLNVVLESVSGSYEGYYTVTNPKVEFSTTKEGYLALDSVPNPGNGDVVNFYGEIAPNLTYWDQVVSITSLLEYQNQPDGTAFPFPPNGEDVTNRCFKIISTDTGIKPILKHNAWYSAGHYAGYVTQLTTTFIVYVLGISTNDNLPGTPIIDNVTLQFRIIETAAPENTFLHGCTFIFDDVAGHHVSNFNGGYGTIENAGVDNNNPNSTSNRFWYKLTLTYTSTTGIDPSYSGLGFTIHSEITWGPDSISGTGAQMFLYIPYTNVTPTNLPYLWELSSDFFTISTGPQSTERTAITVVNPFVGGSLQPDFQWIVGTIEEYTTEFGLEGANAIAVIHQILFSEYPHGIGQPEDDWDQDSFFTVGKLVGEVGEVLRTSLLVEKGLDAYSVLISIMIDLSLFVILDPDTGKLKLKLIRQPLEEDIIELKSHNILAPLPEKINLQSYRTPSRVVYKFKDYEHNFRENTITLDDDGQARKSGGKLSKTNSKLTIPRDKIVAQKVADRRALTDMFAPSVRKYNSCRAARNLLPGDVIREEGETDTQIIVSKKFEDNNSEVEIATATDVYGISLLNILDGPSSEALTQGNNLQEDLFVGVFEIPHLASSDVPGIEILRIRANNRIIGASAHISTEGNSYSSLDAEVMYVGGGTLTGPIVSSAGRDTLVEYGPTIRSLGPDLVNMSKTLSNEQFLLGKQLLRINDELMYVREVEALTGDLYRLRGVWHGALGTTIQDHAKDSVVMVYPAGRSTIYRGVYLKADRIKVKVVPRTVKSSLDIADITPVELTLQHNELIPLSLVNLRVDSVTNSYSTGENVILKWNQRIKEAVNNRDMAGTQAAGEVTPNNDYLDYTITVNIYNVGVTTALKTYEIPGQRGILITNADIITALGSEISFDVGVIISKFRSSPEEILTVDFV